MQGKLQSNGLLTNLNNPEDGTSSPGLRATSNNMITMQMGSCFASISLFISDRRCVGCVRDVCARQWFMVVALVRFLIVLHWNGCAAHVTAIYGDQDESSQHNISRQAPKQEVNVCIV